MAGSICVLRQGVAIVLLIAGLGLLAPSVAEELPVDYESTVPRYIFANTREEQKTQQWLSAIYDELHEMNTVLSPPEVPAKKNREKQEPGLWPGEKK